MPLDADRLEDAFWERHANPKSGWSRVPAGPLLVYAVYRRNWRLLAATLLWTVINPIVFSPPDAEDAWMTRAVRAERWWTREERNDTMGLSYPNVCNTVGAVAFLYAFVAAWRRDPLGAAAGALVSAVSKLWWVGAVVRRYDARQQE